MSGRLIGGVIGAVIGFYFGGPAGAAQGFAIGSTLGGLLFPGKLPDVYGPRLTDLKLQVSTYGTMIPIYFGTNRGAGNVIWKTDMVETEHTEEQGGKGGPTQDFHTYTYSASWAISLCEGPIVGVRKIWADSFLIYDASTTNTGISYAPSIINGTQVVSTGTQSIPGMTVYLGTETQLPDPTMEAHFGVGNVTAYRGQAYIVMTDFQLEKFGNRMPGFSFEVVTEGSFGDVISYYTSNNELDSIVYNPLLNEVWVSTSQDADVTEPALTRINANTGAVVGSTSVGEFVSFYTPMIYDEFDRAVWAYAAGGINKIYKFDAGTGAFLFSASQTDNQGIYLNPFDGSLWIKNTNKVTQVNKDTGAAISVSAALGFNIYDLTFATENQGRRFTPGGDTFIGNIYLTSNTVATNKNLYRYDRTSAGVELVYTDGSTLTNMAYDTTRNTIWILRNSATAMEFDPEFRVATGDTITMAVVPTGGVGSFVYDANRDMLWASRSSTNTITGSAVSTGTVYKTVSGLTFSPTILQPTSFAMFANGTNIDGEVIKIIFDRLTPGTVPLSDVLTSISERTTQLTASDIDVTGQTSVIVDGYTITRQSPARACIEQLQSAYFFDGVESDGKAKFVNRGGTSAVTIPTEDIAAYQAYGEIPDDIVITRAQEVELPKEVNVTYIAKSADYQTGAQQSRRLVGAAGQVTTVELPIVLTDDKARQISEISMYNAWTSRTAYEFSTNLKYIKYEPTDIVTIGNKTIRLLEKEEQQGIIKWKGQAEEIEVYSQAVTGVTTSYIPQTITETVATDLMLLDIPMLRDSDDDAGFYATATGYRSGWNGAVLFKSNDDGASYTEVLSLTNGAGIGSATTVLGDFFGGNTFDEANTVTVSLLAGATLSSATELAVLNGGNAALIGDEIIQYKTATLNGDGSYTISGLLRGRRGTEWAMSTHIAGDRFVALSSSTLRRVPATTAEIGLQRVYKGVSIGSSLSDTTAQTFTNAAEGLECYSPVQLGGGRDASGNITINWVRRTRIGGEWRDLVDVPLGESTESYEVEIWNSTFTTLKRTITGITSATTSYSSANQVTDFGSNQATIYVRVYQLSANVGRGVKLQGTV
jgi:hypothetical protein